MTDCDAQPSDGPTNNSKREITCFKCGRNGHVSHQCRMRETEHSNAAQVIETLNNEDCNGCKPLFEKDSQPVLLCGHTVKAGSAVHEGGSLKMHHGFVNDRPALTIRDSGCTSIGVRKSLVHPSDYTGKKIRSITFNGTVEFYPIL